MENQVLISIPADQFLDEIQTIVAVAVKSEVQKLMDANKPINTETYSINKAAKILKRKHSTVKALVEAGAIRSTDDGRITMAAIEEYLKESS